MAYGKDIHLKIHLPHIMGMASHFPPSLLGTGLLIMISVYHDDIDTMMKLAPQANPVINALVNKGWMEMDLSFKYHLTDKGRQIVEFFLTKAPKSKAENPDVKAVDEWIDKWLNMWPTAIKSGGKPIRSNRATVLKKMKLFVQEYKYAKEVILKATYYYLLEQQSKGWNYTRLAMYFIFKQEGNVKHSDLATWCEAATKPDQSNFAPQATVKQL